MMEQNKTGFFKKLFSEKQKKGGCCSVQFEEVPDENNKSGLQEKEITSKVDEKTDNTSHNNKNTNCCG